MPLSPRSLHPEDHPQPLAEQAPHSFQDWSRQVGDTPAPAAPARFRQGAAAIDFGHPLVKVAAVAFVGYTLGRMIHRR